MKRKTAIFFALALASYIIISLVRLGDVPPPWYDEIAHVNTAGHVINEGRIWCDFYEGKFREKVLFNSMPVQWILLGAFSKLFGVSIVSGRFLYLILSVITVVSFFILIKRLFGKGAALAGACALMCTFMFFYVSRQVIPQVPALTFSMASLCLYFYAEQSCSWVRLFFSGILGGLAYISHPIGASAIISVFILGLTDRIGVRRFFIYVAGIIAAVSPYLVYVAVNFGEYLYQTKFVLKGVYAVQPVYLTVLDELSVRYLGLSPVRNLWASILVNGTPHNRYLYDIVWNLTHLDLKVMLGEMAGRALFIFSFIYVLFKKNKAPAHYKLLIITIVPMALLSIHPNKFGPYMYIVIPFFVLCFVLFIRDLLSIRSVITRAAGCVCVTIFLLANPLFIAKGVLSRKVCDYMPFINGIKPYVEKGARVAAPVYYWPGLHEEYKFISANQIVYETGIILKERYGLSFEELMPSEQEWLIRTVLEEADIEYVFLTAHYWEDITEDPGATKGFGEAMRRYLFKHARKKADLLRENYFVSRSEARSFSEEVYEPMPGMSGFQNVGDEYQKSLKIYEL